MRRPLLSAAAAALLVAGGFGASLAVAPASARTAPATLTPLSIATAHGTRRFRVEVARTEEEQERGLMFRKVVAKGSGMLFPMAPPRVATFWMKNTLIPLDMLFIRADGTIARIAANTVPQTLDLVPRRRARASARATARAGPAARPAERFRAGPIEPGCAAARFGAKRRRWAC